MDSTPQQPFAAESPEPGTPQPPPSAQAPTPSAQDPSPSAQDPSPSAQDPTPSAQDPTPSAQDPTPSAQDLSPSAQDSAQDYRRRFFFGPFGLRAVWSLLLYFAIIALVAGSLHLAAHQVQREREHAAAIAAAKTGKPAPPLTPLLPRPDPSKPMPISALAVSDAIMFAAFFLLSWLMAVIEHRKLSAFGLGGLYPISRFLVGAFWGLAAISLLVATLRGFHLLAFDTRLDHGHTLLLWGAAQLFAFLLVGLTEEYLFRGYIQFTLTRGMVSLGNLFSPRHARVIGFWTASVLTSAIFLYAHTHNAGENWLGLLQVFLVGILFVIALWRTGSLWWAIGFHMAWDWGQSFLYGVPDSGGLMQGRLFATHALGKPLYSGGTVGPEGSVLCIPIMLLAIVVLLYTHPSPQPLLEIRSDPFPPPPAPLLPDNPAPILWD